MKKKEKGTLFLSHKKHPESTSIYDVVKKEPKYGYYHDIKLKFSKKQSSWTRPGETTARLTSDGDGFNFISYNIDGEVVKNYRLDYCEAAELRALLKLVDTDAATFNYFKEK